MASAENLEKVTNMLQLLGAVPGPQQNYLKILTGNAGIAGSLADLVEKEHNGTATRNDYGDFLQDVATVAAATGILLGIATPATAFVAPAIALINYLDRNDWDIDKVGEDIDALANSLGFDTDTQYDDLYGDNYPTFRIFDTQVKENDGKAVVYIVLNRTFDKAVEIDISYRDKTAKAPYDYHPTKYSVTIEPNSMFGYVEIPIINDIDEESSETFEVVATLSNYQDFEVVDGDLAYAPYTRTATITILDDDKPVYITIDDTQIQEGDGTPNDMLIPHQVAVNLSRELKDNEIIRVNFENEVLEFTSQTGTTLYHNFFHNGNFTVNNEKITTQILNPTITSDNVNAKLIKEGIINIIDDDTPIIVTITGNSTSEKSEKLHATATLSRELKDGEFVTIRICGQDIEFKGKNISQNFIVTTWSDDKIEEEDSKFYITPSYINSNATVYFKGKGGKCIIIDDDKNKDPNDPKYYDPLVINLNKTDIELLPIDYGRRFDLDNNGFKESTSWIGTNEAFLALDKNGNGIIDNGNELFTNAKFANLNLLVA